MKIIEDKVYMQYYWDLAAENISQRVKASYDLISYVKSVDALRNEKGNENKYQPLKDYLDYSLKRLIRGLGSPRDHARQGFAVTFSELIRAFHVDASTCIKLIDENLQVSGSAKGSEERDLMFGKLFGYVSIIRAGLVKKSDTTSQDLLERVLVLHSKKHWLQELTIETILSLIALGDSDLQNHILSKIQSLISNPLETLDVNQLLLFIGLLHLAKSNTSFKKLWQKFLLDSSLEEFDLSKIDTVSTQLLSSSRKFPKIHRIWDYLLAFVVPLTVDREIVYKEQEEFTAEQQASLQHIIDFMDAYLWKGTKEKRALALKLTVKIIQVVPADIIPVVISESAVKSIYAARVKKNNLLYDYVGGILEEIVSSVGTSNDRVLALISAFTQIGGANFDSRTNSTTIQNLVKSMNSDTVQQYFTLLCSFVGKTPSNSSEDAMQVDDENKEDQEEAITLHPAIESLQSMIALSKHSNLQNPNSILLPTASILLRLAGFDSGNTQTVSDNAQKSQKKDKKDKKNKKKESASEETLSSEEVKVAVHAVQLLEQSFNKGENEIHITDEVKQFAKEHVMNYLSNCLGRLISTVHPKKNKETDNTASSSSSASQSITFSKDLWTLIGHFFTSNLSLAHSNDEDLELPAYYQQVNETIQYLLTLSSSLTSEHAEKKSTIQKYSENAINLLITTFVAQLIGHHLDVETLLQLPVILKRLVAEKVLGGEAPAEEDEDEELEVRLLDLSIELLSVNHEHSLKGVREIIKRLWNNIFSLIDEENISQSFFDLLIETALPIDATSEQPEGEVLEEEEGENDEDEEEEESEEEEEEETTSNKRKRGNKQDEVAEKNSKKKTKQEGGKKNQSKEQEDDEEDDVIVDEEDMLDLLLTEEDGDEILTKIRDHQAHHPAHDDEGDSDLDEEEKDALLHIEEADEALVKMMKLRQETRKKGIMNMKKQQFLLRSRLLDILEVCIHRLKNSSILFSFFQPLVKAYQSCMSSSLIQEISEGVAYTKRLSQLVLQEYCKKKIHLTDLKENNNSDDEEGEVVVEEFLEEIQDLLLIFTKLLVSKSLELKAFGQETFYFFVKIILTNQENLKNNDKQKQLNQSFFNFFTYLLEKYYYNKSLTSSIQKPQLSIKLLEELFIHRFSSFFLTYQSIGEGKEDEKTKDSMTKNKKKAANKTKKTNEEEGIIYVILSHLLGGLNKSIFFSKRLQILELLNQILVKQFKSPNENKDLQNYLTSQFIADYVKSLGEETKKIVTFSQEKYQSTTAGSANKKANKEFDTKNLRLFMTLTTNVISLLEDNESTKSASLKDHLQALQVAFHELQKIYQTVTASNEGSKQKKQSSTALLSPNLVQSVDEIVESLKDLTTRSVKGSIEQKDSEAMEVDEQVEEKKLNTKKANKKTKKA